jgi:hypothetical protein
MPALVDGRLTPRLVIEALEVLASDGPDDADMTLDEIVEWLELHLQRDAETAPPTQRRRRRFRTPAGRPGRHRLEAAASLTV